MRKQTLPPRFRSTAVSLGIPHRGETAFDWLPVALAVVLAGFPAYVGATTGRAPFFVVDGTFVLGVRWVLGGMRHATVGLVTSLVGVAFVGLAVFLFFVESATVD